MTITNPPTDKMIAYAESMARELGYGTLEDAFTQFPGSEYAQELDPAKAPDQRRFGGFIAHLKRQLGYLKNSRGCPQCGGPKRPGFRTCFPCHTEDKQEATGC